MVLVAFFSFLFLLCFSHLSVLLQSLQPLVLTRCLPPLSLSLLAEALGCLQIIIWFVFLLFLWLCHHHFLLGLAFFILLLLPKTLWDSMAWGSGRALDQSLKIPILVLFLFLILSPWAGNFWALAPLSIKWEVEKYICPVSRTIVKITQTRPAGCGLVVGCQPVNQKITVRFPVSLGFGLNPPRGRCARGSWSVSLSQH